MAKDPVMGPISPMEDPRAPKLPEAEEVQEGDKEVHEEIAALEADSAEELVAGLAEVEKAPELDEASVADVQLEAEVEQTYEYELRTELAMRPLDDVIFMAQQRGVGPVTGLSKEKIARMVLRHEGFAAPEPVEIEPTADEPDLPRHSVRVQRAIESQQR